MSKIDPQLTQEVFQSRNLAKPEIHTEGKRVKGRYKSKVKKGLRLAELSLEEYASWDEVATIVPSKDQKYITVSEEDDHTEVRFALQVEKSSEVNADRFISLRYRIYNSIPDRDHREPKHWAQFFDTQKALTRLTEFIKATGNLDALDPSTRTLSDTDKIPNAMIGESVKITYELVYDPETHEEEGEVVRVSAPPMS